MKRYNTPEGQVTECYEARFLIKRTRHGTASSDYVVELVGGEWPSDHDMITICDGDEPPNSRHFGGRVRKNGNQAVVTVYTD
jgi:hypothetical protein